MASAGDEPEAALYVVGVTGAGDPDAAMLELDSIALSPTLFLVRSELTQSRLYHLVKRRVGAEALFVGRLDGPPKFMGMTPGSLATLRSWGEPGEDDGAGRSPAGRAEADGDVPPAARDPQA